MVHFENGLSPSRAGGVTSHSDRVEVNHFLVLLARRGWQDGVFAKRRIRFPTWSAARVSFAMTMRNYPRARAHMFRRVTKRPGADRA